jgi:hypothetical protein
MLRARIRYDSFLPPRAHALLVFSRFIAFPVMLTCSPVSRVTFGCAADAGIIPLFIDCIDGHRLAAGPAP